MKELAARLRDRRGEIEGTLLTRVLAVSDPAEVGSPEYDLGLRRAVGTALDYAIAELTSEHGDPEPVPEQLLKQARASARNRVSLDTVVRRYSAGYTVLSDFLIEEAEKAGVPGDELKHSLRVQTAVFDRLTAAIAKAHVRETQAGPRTTARRRTELVRNLLSGNPVDSDELGYELDAWHVGMIATGRQAEQAASRLPASGARSTLAVPDGEGAIWIWVGAGSRVSAREALAGLSSRHLGELTVAVGEPAQGIAGWRLTHRQASAAGPIARQRREEPTFYADVCLLASMSQDEVLTKTLHELYIAPLTQRAGGGDLCRTVRAYFAAAQNVSSTAALLKVNRKTVSNRLRLVEEAVGRPLGDCGAEIQAALRLEELDEPVVPRRGRIG